MRKTLIINQGYQPLAAVSWQRAMCLQFRDTVEVISTYEDWYIHSASDVFEVPAVMRLTAYSKPPPSHTKFSRENVYLRDEYTCQYCGSIKPPRNLTFDHVHPRSKGGPTTWTNIVTACRPCNHRKADRTLRESGLKLRNEPQMPNPYKMRHRILLGAGNAELPPEWELWMQHK